MGWRRRTLAAGLASFLASFTGPEGPVDRRVSMIVQCVRALTRLWYASRGLVGEVPFGCVKSPLSTPLFNALLNIESNCASEL